MKVLLKISLVFFWSLCFLPAIGWACPEGTFSVKGWTPGENPQGEVSYTGEVVIKKTGLGYRLDWTIDKDKLHGIGLCDETSQTLYVSYANLRSLWFGIIAYDKNLRGKWSGAGAYAEKWGVEQLIQKKVPNE